MKFRTPLARVRGLGASHSGYHHWQAQRLTAIVLIPLSIWYVASLAAVVPEGYGAVLAWMHSPWTASLQVLFLAAFFYHAHLGVQVIVEDYVHSEILKIATIVGTRFICAVLALVCSFVALRFAVGG